MSVKKSLRDATLTNSKYSFTRNFTVGSPLFRANTGWERNPAWLPMPGFNYVSDPTFTYSATQSVASVKIQSDGKIVIFRDSDYTVRRLNTDGTADSSFTTATFNVQGRVVEIQSDGKILAGGDFTTCNSISKNRIVRLNSDGSIDTSFNVGTGFDGPVYDIKVQADGKILVVGFLSTYQNIYSFTGTNGLTNYASRIVRLNPDGSLDTSFNTGNAFDFNNGLRLYIQSDGKIIVGGDFTAYQNISSRGLVRINPDGSIDTTFPNFSTNVQVYGIGVQSSGKIVVGGLFTTYDNLSYNYIVRFNKDGSLDQSFRIGTGFNGAQVNALLVTSDDYILVGGTWTAFNGTGRQYFARLNPDGSLDTTLDIGTVFNAGTNAIAIQSDAKILVGFGQGLKRLTVTEEKIIILQGIKNTANSEVTEFSCAANYTVNWGDGNTINYTANTIASHTYNYFDANLDNTNGNVSFLDSGDWVVRSNHGYANTNTISFANISTTTGITVDTPYYVINANTNYFNLSNTVGGSAVTLTTDGTGYILPYKQVLINVYPQSGNTITSANLANTSSAVYTSGYSSMFLDIGISAANVTALRFHNSYERKKQYTIERVAIFNSNSITSTNNLFGQLYALQSVPLFNTSKVTDMTSKFENCYSLQVVPLFDTANVTSMNIMFDGCRSLQTVPLFNTAKVTSMSLMFSNCNSLQTVPLFNTAAVLSMYAMFNNCYSLKSVPLFNTAAVTTMSQMFQYCYSLQSVPQFNTSQVTLMDQMFYNCNSLQTVPLFNTAAVTAMDFMFHSCYSLQTVPLFNTAKVISMSYMFFVCYSLESVPLFNTAKVTSMSLMFYDCRSLQSVPLFNTSQVTNMNQMFQNCVSLTSVPQFNTSQVTSMGSTFSGCKKLTSVPLFNTANVTSMNGTFNGCTSLKLVPLFNTAAVTTMGTMFYGCSSLITVPLFNTANVTNMQAMFTNSSSLQSVPLFNTAKVTSMDQMFFGTIALKTIPLFNTANVTRMDFMFYSSGIQSVPLLNTSKVTNMQSMFDSCRNLQSVPLFNTSNVTIMTTMFQVCFSLKEIPALNANSVTTFSDMFNQAGGITRSQLANVRYTHSYLNNNLANVELNEIYTNLPTVTSQTITVTGNWGTASDDPTIATAKGWTVTG